MKSNVITIIRKELRRFFFDPRLVISTLILPGLLIYLVYSFMGNGFTASFSTPDSYVYKVDTLNVPESIRGYFEGIYFIEQNEVDGLDEGTERLDSGESDALVVFPEGFDDTVAKRDPEDIPNIDIFYNSSRVPSAEAYTNLVRIFDSYEKSISNVFDINNTEKQYDLSTQKEVTSKVFSMILPMLIMVFLFSGCMSIAPESIAGEKERGTIATLLVTPVSRSEIAIGKILSVSFIALLSGISSAAGTILSLPKLVGLSGQVDASGYGIGDYAFMLLVILSTIMVIVSVMSIVSAFARTVKEANTAVLPLMIISMLVSVTTMFGSSVPNDAVWYLIPLYNSVQCMSAIFGMSYSLVNVITTVSLNVSLSIVLLIVLARMFNNEKIMFSR
ncbi:MAG: ABC transporter permease [Clostridia bacterium]|nr:ABC transporter permease [Clostridia bacterium]